VRSSNLRLFVAGGLLVAIGLAMLVSGFASGSPDGLNKVAEDHGFAANARQHLFENGPLAGYAVKGVNGDRLSTGISGLIGVLVTFGIGLALFALLRAMRSGGHDRSQPTRAP
jgi:mannose/fructose/N-acetylgalactosamine-specific phosphotransferase system component IIC